MFKKAIALLMAATASAKRTPQDLNEELSEYLEGRINHPIDLIYEKYLDSEISLVEHDESRFELFKEKVKDIIMHNANPENKYRKGLSKFSSMTFQEVKDYYNMDAVNAKAEQACSATMAVSFEDVHGGINIDVPDSWNWQEHGGVSPVKDQGNCGSCWTFSTVGCLESNHLIKYETLSTYSEQQLVDCAGDFQNFGCNGGLPSQAFEYIHYNGGIESEDSYPYTAKDGTCVADSSKYVLGVTDGARNVTAGDEDELKSFVYDKPVSVAFEVVDGFSDYTSGVYTSTTCGNTQADVNHAVLAVGYGTDDDGTPYWIVKNSWSDTWGDKGFFKIERGVNMCGIAMCNSVPVDVEELNQVFLQ